MKPYYTWKATLDDESVINQFEGKKETLFKEVEDNKNKLVTFRIEAEDGEFYEVNMSDKTINCNDEVLKTFSVKEDVELVYSRRNQARIEVGTGKILDSRVIHRIGLKTDNDELIIEAFPGLKMAERNIKIIDTTNDSNVKEDLTSQIKKKI